MTRKAFPRSISGPKTLSPECFSVPDQSTVNYAANAQKLPRSLKSNEHALLR